MREKVKDKGRLEHILSAINGILADKELYTLEQVKHSTLVFYGFSKYFFLKYNKSFICFSADGSKVTAYK